MPNRSPLSHLNDIDLSLLDRVALVQRICLTVVALIAIVALSARALPALGILLPACFQFVSVEAAALALFSAASLLLTTPLHTERRRQLGLGLASLVTVSAGAALFEYSFHISLHFIPGLGVDAIHSLAGRMTLLVAISFLLLGVLMLLGSVRRWYAVRFADLLALCLCFLILVIDSEFIFSRMQMFGAVATGSASGPILSCLTLLVLVALLQRAESGFFAVLLRSGIGSNIARIASPTILLLPFLRETIRARAVEDGLVRGQYASAIVTSLTGIIGLVLILYMTRKIDSLERAVLALSLRDELTGVSNRRGFYILAEQSLRLARRSASPFSVLYVDMDDLKQINDSLGHDTGSHYLREMADLLKSTFRETDVVGRIGGDEFVVAGQFSEDSLQIAVLRLEDASNERNAAPNRRYPLKFSVGSVTSKPDQSESLDDLIGRADTAMYEAKRQKRTPPAPARIREEDKQL